MKWNYHTGESKIPNFITMEEYYREWYQEWLLLTLFKEDEVFIFKTIDGIPMVKLGVFEESNHDKLNLKLKKTSNLCEEIIIK